MRITLRARDAINRLNSNAVAATAVAVAAETLYRLALCGGNLFNVEHAGGICINAQRSGDLRCVARLYCYVHLSRMRAAVQQDSIDSRDLHAPGWALYKGSRLVGLT